MLAYGSDGLSSIERISARLELICRFSVTAVVSISFLN